MVHKPLQQKRPTGALIFIYWGRFQIAPKSGAPVANHLNKSASQVPLIIKKNHKIRGVFCQKCPCWSDQQGRLMDRTSLVEPELGRAQATACLALVRGGCELRLRSKAFVGGEVRRTPGLLEEKGGAQTDEAHASLMMARLFMLEIEESHLWGATLGISRARYKRDRMDLFQGLLVHQIITKSAQSEKNCPSEREITSGECEVNSSELKRLSKSKNYNVPIRSSPCGQRGGGRQLDAGPRVS